MLSEWSPLRALVAAVALSACGGEPPASAGVTVRFEYRAATATNPAVEAAHPNCVALVGVTHIHPGWREFRLVPLIAESAELWSIELGDVPASLRQSIRISDPNACAENPTGAVTAHRVFANGVLLTRQVQTPGGEGPEPGFSFAVDAEGRVRP